MPQFNRRRRCLVQLALLCHVTTLQEDEDTGGDSGKGQEGLRVGGRTLLIAQSYQKSGRSTLGYRRRISIGNVDQVEQSIYTCYDNDTLNLHVLSQQYTQLTATPSKQRCRQLSSSHCLQIVSSDNHVYPLFGVKKTNFTGC